MSRPSRAHNERWLTWLLEEIPKLGLEVTPSVANFVLIHFPDRGRAHRRGRRRISHRRGLILRRVTTYTSCPNALRMSVGTEEANRLVVGRSREFMERRMTGTQVFNRLALIGMGLIGSSIARAARAQGAARIDRGHGPLPGYAAARCRAGLCRSGCRDQCRSRRRRRSRHSLYSGWRLRRGGGGDRLRIWRRGAIVSDVGSVKGCRYPGHVAPYSRGRAFRPGASGRRAPSIPDLTPVSPSCSSTDGASSRLHPALMSAAMERLAAFWRLLGANVENMSAEHHDLVLGITSHLPHLIAYTIVGTADELSQVTRSEVLQFSAGGFRDFTRIAASDPTMWRDVFIANKDAVLEMLGRFQEDLAALTRAIRRGDGDTLFDHFSRTRAIRRGIVEIGQDFPAPDFGRPHPDLPQERLPRPYSAES